MEALANAINRAVDFASNIGAFFNGFSNVLLKALVIWSMTALFHYIVPPRYGKMMKFNAIAGTIIYICNWWLAK